MGVTIGEQQGVMFDEFFHYKRHLSLLSIRS
ncbi:hypothetical protein BOMU111920_26715 [Bordetella muralis]